MAAVEGALQPPGLLGVLGPGEAVEPLAVDLEERRTAGEPPKQVGRLPRVTEDVEGRRERFRSVELAETAEVLGVRCDEERQPATHGWASVAPSEGKVPAIRSLSWIERWPNGRAS